MGMAASQARYLALVARKSNCEYEGQQINQQRTSLSNESASLFASMLSLEVPTPPSKSDYTKTVYTYSDGTTTSTITDWKQLSTPDTDYNYEVTREYTTNEYTGSLKKLSDPQVQFTTDATKSTVSESALNQMLDQLTAAKKNYDTAVTNYDAAKTAMKELSTYANNTIYKNITSSTYDSTSDAYTIVSSNGTNRFVNYNSFNGTTKYYTDSSKATPLTKYNNAYYIQETPARTETTYTDASGNILNKKADGTYYYTDTATLATTNYYDATGNAIAKNDGTSEYYYASKQEELYCTKGSDGTNDYYCKSLTAGDKYFSTTASTATSVTYTENSDGTYTGSDSNLYIKIGEKYYQNTTAPTGTYTASSKWATSGDELIQNTKDSKYYQKATLSRTEYLDADGNKLTADDSGAYHKIYTGTANETTKYYNSVGTELTKMTIDGTEGYYREYTGSVYTETEGGDETKQAEIKAIIANLQNVGALSDTIDMSTVYYDSDSKNIAFASDLSTTTSGADTLTVYNQTEVATKTAAAQTELSKLELLKTVAETNYNTAKTACDGINLPSAVGNCKLTYCENLTDAELAELQQVVKTMTKDEVSCNALDCFQKNADGTYAVDENGNYIYTGGAYTFTMNGTTYFTTASDLYTSYNSGTGTNNQIDGQTKMAYYNSSYLDKKITETKKALLQTDGNGRFQSVKFEDDSVVYTLDAATESDDDAYNDAMNQYNYQEEVYEKTVQDINAKTSIIQQQDVNLELRLKQLDTEQNALKTEIDAVSAVVKDNIEKDFKTFSS